MANNCANVVSTQILVDVYIRLSGTTTDMYLIKDGPVPVGSALSTDGKFNLASVDFLVRQISQRSKSFCLISR